eukprot:m.160698 g.160698  ORF g.160698 m.160698 type:complete len:537 (-) comp11982_c0_seq1:200-1810(-)
MARWTPPPAPQHSSTPCCNSSRVVPGARFCPNCGAASPTNASPPLPPYSSTMRDKGLYEDAPLLPGDATPSRDKGSLMVKLLVFLCGVAAFARTEAVLLQTQYFAMCRGYGPQFFYAISAALLFIPGPFVIGFVRIIEAGSTTPIRVRAFRKILIANVSTALAIMMLIAEIAIFGSVAEEHKLAYLYMPIIGIGSSLHFQAMSQALSFFPPVYMSILIVGCYCPFVVYAPINSVGHLCTATLDGGSSADPASCGNTTGNAAVQDTCVTWEADWSAVWSFFGTAVVLCVQAILAMYMLCKHPLARHYMSLADDEHVDDDDNKEDGAQYKLLGDDAEARKAEGDVMGGSIQAEGKGSESESESNTHVGWIAAPQVYCVLVVIIASQLVTAQYGMIPVQGGFMYLTTYLLYEYYICSCLGSVLAMVMPLGDITSVLLATLRIAVVPLTFSYEAMPGLPAATIPRSNVMALVVNFAFITSGAWIFSSTFSMLQTKLADRPKDKKWALNLNNGVYFFAMELALAISISIGFFVWGPDGQGP